MVAGKKPPADPPKTRNAAGTPEPFSRTGSLRLLALGFGLTFLHLFWYGSPWTAWLAVVCYAPFMIWLQDYSRKPFRAGWLFGLYYGVMNETWLGQFAAKYTHLSIVGFFVVLFIAGVWGCFYGFACWLRTKIVYLRSMPLFALLMFGMEFCRMNVPEFEYPNCPIGEPLVVYPAVAPVLGSAYICLLFVLIVNALLAEFVSKPVTIQKPFKTFQVKTVPVFIGCILLTVTLLVIRGNTPPKKIGIRVALGQLGTDLAYSDEAAKPFLIEAAANSLTDQALAQNADLLIFPEGVAHFEDQPVTPFKLDPRLPVVFGTQHGRSPTYQAAYLWNGRSFSHTDKMQLVVFGEQVPFRNVIPYPKDLALPQGDLVPGTERHLLEVKPGIKAGVMICYESMFWKAAHDFNELGADFLAVISLDDWYMGTNGIPRLAIAARWRAVETKKWLVRVGSLGKTMVIDPKGRVMSEIPTGPRQLLVYDL